MHVALITPYFRPLVRGNAVTVQRIERHLNSLGCTTNVFPLDELSDEEVIHTISGGQYDLCHCFHAHGGGAVARRIRACSGVPFIITVTGSDIYEALGDNRREETLASLQEAAAVVAFHENIAFRVARLAGSLRRRIAVIPQGVELPDETPSPDGNGFTFLLPAGIRPVKNILFPLEALSPLCSMHPGVRLLIAGPALDSAYLETVMARLPEYPFAAYLGEMDHARMGELYRQASVILNSSSFEGGMANSLLEAMAHGRPVLASDIEGNRSLVTDGVNGLLYADRSDFMEKAELLLNDGALRRRLGEAGRELVREQHDPAKEAAAYLRLYGEVMGTY